MFGASFGARQPAFVSGMHIIIGMFPHIIMTGAPMAIIEIMASQRSFMRAIIDGSVGTIFIVMPSLVISQDIRHIIGIMPLIIIGTIIGVIMPGGIMPFVIGIMLPVIGIMLPVIGIMPFIIEPMGIPIEPMGIPIEPIGIEPIGIMGAFIIGIGIGIAFMASSSVGFIRPVAFAGER